MNADALSISQGHPRAALELDRIIGMQYQHTDGIAQCVCGSKAAWMVGAGRIYVRCARAGCVIYEGKYPALRKSRDAGYRQERLL